MSLLFVYSFNLVKYNQKEFFEFLNIEIQLIFTIGEKI
tara:strand:+ start:198 stop:311 length:114 start_codon:yes stop_codon:yes gene_type:complete